jgi:aspartyl protease family protein
MMRFAPFVLATIGIGALVGWFGPDASDQVQAIAASAPATPAVASANRLAVAQEAASVTGELVLPRGEDGHFYADVTIDGATSRMLVDTGATVIALTGEDADAMGIYWDETAVRPVARGANGMVYGVPVTLEAVELGPIEARGVEAVVVPQGLGISLLGQSFLSRIEKVEMDQQRMVLGS